MNPIPGGTHRVNERMLEDLEHAVHGEHPSNLGAALARSIGDQIGVPSFVVDPVSVDELMPKARISGISDLERPSWFHALNHKAVARWAAERIGKKYEESSLIIAHLGSGNSVVAHKNGQMIDGSGGRTNGPFSPERSGGLPTYPLVELCYSGRYTKAQMMKKIRGEGGMSALLGTHDCREIERRIQAGDERAALVYKAQALQIAKGVGTLLGCFTELIDAVILTGGLAYSKMLTDMVIGYLHNLARVVVIPGENEMEALALGGLRLLRGEEPVHTFAPACDLSVIP